MFTPVAGGVMTAVVAGYGAERLQRGEWEIEWNLLRVSLFLHCP